MEAPPPIAPITIGAYTLGELLGRGGMSEVYACTHPRHGPVALKLLHDDADGAFHVESATRDVIHESVVRVLDAGLDPHTRRHYLVMERLDGPDLATHLSRGPLDEPTARALFAQIADGMHAVHAHGIVHRDLKPANVMLHHGRPRIVDFGIAKILGDNAALVTSRRIGTLGYMAPEQLVGGKIAPSVDVWALGIMLFEAVAGRLPFDGFTDSYSPQLVETAPRVRSITTVSPAYDALVAACLDADPAKRPPMVYVGRALRGEVAIETAVDERVTQDIGAMPTALSSSGTSGASSSGASSSGASASGASSRIALGTPPSRVLAPFQGKRALVWIVTGASVIALAIAVSMRSPSGTSPSTGGARDEDRVSDEERGGGEQRARDEDRGSDEERGDGEERARESRTAPAPARETAPDPATAPDTATAPAPATASKAAPASDRPRAKTTKRTKKRAKTTPRRETLD